MDPFEKIPPELIRQIILYTADFATVENVISVSPHIFAVLQAHLTITRDLILDNPITSLPEMQRLCYNIALINSPLTHIVDLPDYQQSCEGTPSFSDEQSLCLIQTAAQIQRLACACLSLIQRNLVSAVEHLPASSINGPERAIKAVEPFSWIEEYRVYWSLWHLRHYSDLRKAATQHWSWSESSVHGLDA
ncbi:uncharacterized protein BJX67DRAFT_377222 [Aspergillus lucknowensis]|uniref:Transcription factor domain-containing protein n=1 Tax=Aspergillus lucknowensis TaxID=176173 RepID=A0ABR4M4C8_9EURO